MKLLFAFLFALSILGCAESACLCYPNQNVSSTIAAVTIGGPTETGNFGSPTCAPVQCSTVVTFNGNLANGLAAGAQISVVACGGVSAANSVTLVERPQTFTSCPSLVYKFNITYSNVFTFKYNLTSAVPITFTVVLQPIEQVPMTTTAAPAPTTPVYSGVFPYNPAIARMDLTIGLDTSAANEQFYNQSKEVIANIVKYFTYSPDFVRLSFMTFDPYAAAGTGKYPLWSHTNNTINDYLNNMPFYPGSPSKYLAALKTFFFDKLTVFPLRNNTERIFIIVTGTDGDYDSALDPKIQKGINDNDIKFIYVNMNTNVSTSAGPGAYYQNLKLITGTGSNTAKWFDYQTNQNNAENILTKNYFNGNTLCNAPVTPVQPVTGAPIPYSVPLNNPVDSTKLYCNYMNDVQTYASTGPGYLQVYFSRYELSNRKDFISIGVNGTEVSVLTGQYGSAYYCIPGTPVTVTFQSSNGLVYTGYTSIVSFFAAQADCQKPPTPAAVFIDHTKKQ